MSDHTRRAVVASLAALTAGCLGRRGAGTASPDGTGAGSPTPSDDPESPADRTDERTPDGETAQGTARERPTIDAVDGAWPLPAGDAGRTRFDPGGTVPASTPRVAWTAEVGGQPGQVVVADGRVLVGTRRGVTAFEAATGRPLWQHALDADRAGGPVVGDAVYVAAGDEVVALAGADGSVRWRTATGAGPADYLVPAGGTVYAGTRGESGRGGADPAIVALGAGGVDWRATADDWPVARFAEVAVVEEAVYAIAWSGGSATAYYALDRASGDVRWHDGGISHATGLTVADGTLVAGGFYGQVEVRRAADGADRWESSLKGAVTTTGVDDAGVLASGFDTDGDDLRAYAPGGGGRWRAPPGGRLLAAGDGVVVVGGDRVAGVDRTDGTVRWTREVADWRPRAAALADGVLVLAGDDGLVRALV